MLEMLEMLVFIDETSLKTNLVKSTGWAPVGKRLIDHAPLGHWHTQTFVAGRGHDGLIAPSVLESDSKLTQQFQTHGSRRSCLP